MSKINIDGVYEDPKLLTVTNSTKSPVTIGSAVKTVDASKCTKAVEITGNDKLFGERGNDAFCGVEGNDTLSNDSGNDIIFGEAGNDCLIGGVGNDTFWGNAGADKFIYSFGDDIIYGFDSKDTFTLDGLDFTASYSKKYNQVTLTFDSGSIKLKDHTATTFHIDNDTYKISGSKFVNK